MRLLFVCSSYSVFGAEILTLSLMRELRERGHELRAVVSLRKWSNGDFHQRLEEMGIPYEELPLGVVSKSLRLKYVIWTLNCLVRQPITWWRYTRLTRRFSPEVIVLTSLRHAILLWPLLDRRRTYLYVHGIFQRTAWARCMCQWLDRRLAGYVAVSDFIGRNIAGVGLPEDKIDVVKNGPLDSRDPVAAKRRLGPAGAEIIGIVGQIGAWKGHDDLIQAAELLMREGRDFRVRVFGDGELEYVEQLKAEIRRRGLYERFEWMGFVRDAVAVYGAIDICVVPSRFDEPFGLVAVEAAAAALPVVATRCGGLPEIIVHEECGFLVTPKCPRELAERLGQLLGNVELCRRMGACGSVRVWSLFTSEKMAAAFEKLCERLRESKQPGVNARVGMQASGKS